MTLFTFSFARPARGGQDRGISDPGGSGPSVCRRAVLAGGAGFAAAMILPGRAAAQSGAEMLAAVDRVRAPGDHFAFDVDLDDQTGVQMELTVRVRDRTKGLVRYVSPVKIAGRSILFVERSMWVYVPGSRRELRISPLQQVLGGVASADIARIVYSSDYMVESAAPGNGGQLVLQLVRQGKGAAYARIALTIDQATSHPVMAEFYASNGVRKIKTLLFEGYTDVLGRQRPMRFRVIDHLDGDRVTSMVFSKMRLEETPETWFQPSYLSRLQ